MDNGKRCSSCRRMLELDEYPWDRGKRYATCRACKALASKFQYDRKRAEHKLTRAVSQ